MAEITDPTVLSQLEGEQSGEVKNPAVLAQLNAGAAPPREPSGAETMLEPFKRLGTGLYNVLASPYRATQEGIAAYQGMQKGDYGPLKHIGSESLRGLQETAQAAPTIAGGTMGALSPIPGGAYLGAAAGQGLTDLTRYLTGEEQVSPQEAVIRAQTAGLGTVSPGQVARGALRGAGAVVRTAAKTAPGAAVPMQQEAIQTARQTVAGLPAPSATPIYNTLKAVQQLGGVENIPMTGLAQKAESIAQELKPVTDAWKVNPNPRLQSAANTLDKFFSSGGTELPITQIQQILQDLGPGMQRAAGQAGGALKAIWGAAKRGLQEAADAGSPQAQALLEAQKVHRRYESIQATTGRGETPSLRELVERKISRTKEGGHQKIDSASVLEQLPEEGVQSTERTTARLAETLTPAEQEMLRAVFTKLAKTPQPGSGMASFIERLPVYTALGLVTGGAYGAGGGASAMGTGAAGVLAAEALTNRLRAMAAERPGYGRAIVRGSQYRPQPGAGTRALDVLGPTLSQFLKGERQQ